MESQDISTLQSLSTAQKSALKRVNIPTVTDLILLSTSEIVKKCRISHHEAQELVNAVCDELAPPLHSLGDPELPKDEMFTTGDATIDRILGGGIRTGKLWEVVGESAAGKTQFAMQLSLCVQLPEDQGGVSGSACFLSTSWTLPTNRLLEIVDAHPLLSSELCGLADIHTLKTPTMPMLRHVLSTTLPAFLDEIQCRPGAKPVKLVIVDALTELFHSHDKMSYTTLFERSKHLAEISALLHSLASQHRIAIVAINEVIDSIDRGPPPDAPPHEVSYRDQARWFNRADSVPGENMKEAALGLVWANQVNARIMLSRTKRMRYLNEKLPAAKRPKLNTDSDVGTSRVGPTVQDDDQPIRLRRLTVIFNSVAPPGSVDYVITAGGITGLADQDGDQWELDRSSLARKTPAGLPDDGALTDAPGPVVASSQAGLDDLVLPSEVNVMSEGADAAENGPQVDGEDEWDAYWKDDELGSDVYTQVDLDALSSSPSRRNY